MITHPTVSIRVHLCVHIHTYAHMYTIDIYERNRHINVHQCLYTGTCIRKRLHNLTAPMNLYAN